MATTTPTTGLTYDDLVALQERPENELLRLELIDLVDGCYVAVSVEDEIARSRIDPGFEIALADLFEVFP